MPLIPLLFLLLFPASAFCSRFPSSLALPCPIDFSYVSQFPPSDCQLPSNNSTSPCCNTLLNTFRIGLALYLRSFGSFELPDNASVASCFHSFRSALLYNGVPIDAFSQCFFFDSATMFVQSPFLCSGIVTADDWRQNVGVTSMDSSCAGDLSDYAVCKDCNTDASAAIAKANSLSGNNSGCPYFGVLYAAGVVNTFGPTSPGTAACLLASVALDGSDSGQADRYLPIGAGFVIVSICLCSIAIWLCCLDRPKMFVRTNKAPLCSCISANVETIWYDFEDVKAATDSFAEKNLIGVGGFATTYKGVMPDGCRVVVKRIKNCTPEEDAEFADEVEAINTVRHQNLVVIRGCCVASTTSLGHLRLLVYDYMSNGSLEDYLFSGRKPVLEWIHRIKIVLGAGEGIAYLHSGVQPSIIHKDIKAKNILLDDDLNARVADFGFAGIIEKGMAEMTTRVAGAQGYMAPEYALYGQITDKSDVYSFGVLVLVIMSGRPALDFQQDARRRYPLITDWAWAMVKEGKTREFIDDRISYKGPFVELMERFVLVGILCADMSSARRPSMAQALKMLQGDVDIPSIPDRPLPLTLESFKTLDNAPSFSSMTSAPDLDYTTEDLLR